MSATDERAGTPVVRTPLGEVGRLVARRVRFLEETRDRSGTVAMLAHLRANVGRDPGTDPRVWQLTMDGVPGTPRGDDPSVEELAVHAALTLYALHQQARPTGMHAPGVGLGRAVARLERVTGGSEPDRTSPVRRRFDAVVTSDGLTEAVQHLRGLVSQMRGAGLGLDYGMLADDLDQLQRPGGADVVRRRWARQYHHLDPDVGPADASTTAQTDTNTEEQQ